MVFLYSIVQTDICFPPGLALYRSLLRQCSPSTSNAPWLGETRFLAQQRFRRYKDLQSPSQVANALKAGYQVGYIKASLGQSTIPFLVLSYWLSRLWTCLTRPRKETDRMRSKSQQYSRKQNPSKRNPLPYRGRSVDRNPRVLRNPSLNDRFKGKSLFVTRKRLGCDIRMPNQSSHAPNQR